MLDVLIQDLTAYADCPTDKDLIELALWRRIAHARNALEDIIAPSVIEFPPMRLKTKEQEGASFRDFYIAEFTETFGTQLTAMKEAEESFDQQKLSMLAECMESGVDFFDVVEQDLAKVTALKGGKKRRIKVQKEEEQSGLALNLTDQSGSSTKKAAAREKQAPVSERKLGTEEKAPASERKAPNTEKKAPSNQKQGAASEKKGLSNEKKGSSANVALELSDSSLSESSDDEIDLKKQTRLSNTNVANSVSKQGKSVLMILED